MHTLYLTTLETNGNWLCFSGSSSLYIHIHTLVHEHVPLSETDCATKPITTHNERVPLFISALSGSITHSN